MNKSVVKCDCGHTDIYPENRKGVILCMSCVMAYDYAKSARQGNYSLFN